MGRRLPGSLLLLLAVLLGSLLPGACPQACEACRACREAGLHVRTAAAVGEYAVRGAGAWHPLLLCCLWGRPGSCDLIHLLLTSARALHHVWRCT